MAVLHVPWDHFERAITKNVSSVSSALVILLLIGALSGTWMVSGVVPTLIYYGLQIIHPDIFLFSTCLTQAGVVDHITRGQKIADLITIGGSMDYIVPDMDR